MNKAQRRLFTLFFVFLFFLVAPTIVLLAQGYQFNLEDNIFIYSGSVTIKSWPKDIDIYLDGEKQDNKKLNLINGSYTINGVRPGKYTLTCSKPGYTDWEKEIRVRSGISTEFWNVLLFPKEEAQEIEIAELPGEAQQIFLFPKKNDQLILFTEQNSENQIYLLDLKKSDNQLIFKTNNYNFVEKSGGLNIEWNSNNKKFILPTEKDGLRDFLVIDTDNKDYEKFTPLNQFFPKDPIHKVRWMFDEKDEMAILTKSGKFYSFDYQREIPQLIAENVSGFDFSDYSIYYSQLPNNLVWQIKQNDLKNKKQITSEAFELKNDLKFLDIIAYDENRIVLNNLGETLIYNKDTENDSTLSLRPSENISNIQFSNDGKKLLCWNDHEVWYYMLREWEVQPKRYFGDKITITRSSEPIKNIQWMDNYENILFSTDKNIRSFEIDPRNKTNVSDIFDSKDSIEDKNLLYNKSNQTTYLLTENKILSLKILDARGFLGF
jgi:hypothetical protein